LAIAASNGLRAVVQRARLVSPAAIQKERVQRIQVGN
jgi:hypothetical protein